MAELEDESASVEEEEETRLLDSFAVEEVLVFDVVVDATSDVLSVADVCPVEEASLFVLHPTMARETRDNKIKFLFFMYKILQLQNKDRVFLIKVQEKKEEKAKTFRKSAIIFFSPHRRNRLLLYLLFQCRAGKENQK